MQSHRDRLALLDRLASDTVNLGVAHCRAEDERSDGRRIRIEGRALLNFGSCSYLGLELDERVMRGAIEATRAHGVETSSSRAYLSSGLYTRLEELLEDIFENPIVVAATTTLGHLAALPALVDDDDAIILDHQVHASVQMASRLVHAEGVHVEVVRHNHLARLEKRITRLAAKHRQVWYMADGVYSMFGDLAPIPELRALLDRHESLRVYVDDAHGMSWCGPRGSGTVLGHGPLHERMVLSTGLAKGFGTGGGVIVLPDTEQRRKIRTCGPTLIFGGPLQPPILGAAIESAKIHLSDEIDVLQAELAARMEFCDALFAERALPLVSSAETPVGFVGTGPTEASQNLCLALKDEGFFTNPAQFPATPARRSGGRFLLTRHHRLEDIEALVEAIDRHWESSVRAAGAEPAQVFEAFGLDMPEAPRRRRAITDEDPATAMTTLRIEAADSVDKLGGSEWDAWMAGRGGLSATALRAFERTFRPDAAEVTERWEYRYYVVRDADDRPILATFFTAALWKADMLADEAVSRAIEADRRDDPLHLTQKVFSMGCLLSEGDHLWVDSEADEGSRREALMLLLGAVRADAQTLGCDLRVFRDLPVEASWATSVLEDAGFLRMASPDGHVLCPIPEDDDALLARLSHDHRRHQKKSVRPFDDRFRVEIAGVEGRALAEGESATLHDLYLQVKEKSLELNTFALPASLIAGLAASEGWEILIFRATDASPDSPPVGFVAGHRGEGVYTPLFAGLDYAYVEQSGLYRQVLRQVVARARALGLEKLQLGFGASLEKRRFGARPVPGNMFIEADDHYAFDALAQMSADGNG